MRKFYFGFDLGHFEWKMTILEENSTGDFVSFNQAVKNETLVKGEIIDESAFTAQLENIFSNLSESLGNYPIREAALTISLPQFQTHFAKGYTFPQGNIEEEDIEKAIRMAKTSIALSNQEILLEFPNKFILDNEQVIRDPKGMNAKRLDVEVIFVSVFKPIVTKIKQTFKDLRINLLNLQPSIFLASQLALSKREKEVGAVLIDFGGTSTALVVFQGGVLQDFKTFKFGCQNLIEDLALHLKISVEEAEEIRNQVFPISSAEQKIEPSFVKVAGAKEKRGKNKKDKSSLKKASIEKFLEKKFKEYVDDSNFVYFIKELKKKRKIMGAVLLGGGMLLRPSIDWFKEILSMPIKLAKSELKILEEREDYLKFFASTAAAYYGLKSASETGFWQRLRGLLKNFGG
jgi:cell division protein FtsA